MGYSSKTRRRKLEKPEIVVKPSAPGSGANPNVPVAVSQEDVWKVLQLVSLDYELNFKKVPREHFLPPYVPLMTSKNARVREVAALSAQWEIDIWEVQKAFKNRVGSVKGFLGVPTPRPANAQPDAVQPEASADIKAALAKANREGLLEFYNLFDYLLDPVEKEVKKKPGEDDRNKNPIGKMSQSSAEYYRTQLVVAMKQAFLWSRAEALAKSTTNADNSRGNDIEVKGVFERGKTWGTVIVRNKSTTDLEHITITFMAPKKALPPGSPALDFILGAGVGGDIDSNKENLNRKDVLKKVKAGLNLVGAGANDRAFHEMPVQVFVHIPKLAPNAECEIRLFRTSAEFAATISANYSVWAGSVAFEWKPLPGYEAEKNNKTAPVGNAASDPKDLFPKGSIWRGTVKWTSKGVPDLSRATEIAVTARNGNKFKGTIKYTGNGVNGVISDIVGEVENGAIKFEFVSSAGKTGLLHTGTIKDGRIEITYEEGGDKPVKSVTTLNRVADGKK